MTYPPASEHPGEDEQHEQAAASATWARNTQNSLPVTNRSRQRIARKRPRHRGGRGSSLRRPVIAELLPVSSMKTSSRLGSPMWTLESSAPRPVSTVDHRARAWWRGSADIETQVDRPGPVRCRRTAAVAALDGPGHRRHAHRRPAVEPPAADCLDSLDARDRHQGLDHLVGGVVGAF